MSWTDFARTNFAANKGMRTGRFDYLVERDVLIAQRPFAIDNYAEASQTAASWADAADFQITVADYAVAGWFLHGFVQVKVAAGSGGMIRLVNVTDSNDGTAQTGISNTTYAFSSDLSVQVDAGAHTDLNVKVQIQGDGSNAMLTINNVGGYQGLFRWSPT